MDRKHIDDNHSVARYLADQLTDDEREEFEAYLRDHPDLVREIEAAARFKVGLDALEAKGELDPAIRAPGISWRARALALAAAVAVMAVGVAFWVTRGPSTGPLLASSASALLDSQGRALPATDPYPILRSRGSRSHDALVTLPAKPAAIALRVLPEYPPIADSSYRLRLSKLDENEQERALGEISGLRAEEDGFVAAYVRSDSLQPGTYRLRLMSGSATSSSNESAYGIKVRNAPPSP